jgi:hypothetical protein
MPIEKEKFMKTTTNLEAEIASFFEAHREGIYNPRNNGINKFSSGLRFSNNIKNIHFCCIKLCFATQ